jgi:hypothetical protein
LCLASECAAAVLAAEAQLLLEHELRKCSSRSRVVAKALWLDVPDRLVVGR